MLHKVVFLGLGGILFIIGMILFPLPVPFGLPVMIIGLALMFKASNTVKRKVIILSKKNQHTDKVWQKIREYRHRK